MASVRRTRVERVIRARPPDVYRAFLVPELLARWLPPTSMHGVVHRLEPRVGGAIRMSLTYDDPDAGPGGKTTRDTDTFEGRITALETDRLVIWAVDFESADTRMAGAMDVTWEFEAVAGGTRVVVTCAPIPEGIRIEDNQAGSADSLRKLAELVE